ncbi:hypothetical protein BJ170DRAFT_643108 [Xylariales sp. AK1849]|nr:hypothetical protein BJ170DRAFT_643108 [Xylariales sp. AK1849]
MAGLFVRHWMCPFRTALYCTPARITTLLLTAPLQSISACPYNCYRLMQRHFPMTGSPVELEARKTISDFKSYSMWRRATHILPLSLL